MSERGTFVTSFLYDGKVVPVLQKTLPKLAHTILTHEGQGINGKRPVWFAGQIKGTYHGQELELFERWVDEILKPALPSEHGVFEIVVLSENASCPCMMISFKNGETYGP